MYNSEQFTPNPEQWWDTKGPFWTLHAINPLRVNYIQQYLQQTGLLGLDIGCGGGILTEELAKHHSMTGIDIDKNLIEIAKTRRPDINYLALTSDQVSEQFANKFDFITCLEVLEHVENPRAVIADIKKMLKPNGFIFYSTLNRNPISFLGAIIAAEYILNLLPKHTHLYEKFIKPHELLEWNLAQDISLVDFNGIHYNPINRSFFMAGSLMINYIGCFQNNEQQTV